jgi:hypothetical protein
VARLGRRHVRRHTPTRGLSRRHSRNSADRLARVAGSRLRFVHWPHGLALAHPAVDVVNFQSFSASLADSVGCTPFSFSLNLGVWIAGDTEARVLKPDKKGRPRPAEWECTKRTRLAKSVQQPWFEPFTAADSSRWPKGLRLHREGLGGRPRGDADGRGDGLRASSSSGRPLGRPAPGCCSPSMRDGCGRGSCSRLLTAGVSLRGVAGTLSERGGSHCVFAYGC